MAYGDVLVHTTGPSYGQPIVRNVGTAGGGGGGVPDPHAASHENGGADEIDLTGLSGGVGNPLTADLDISTFDLVSGVNHVISYTGGKVHIDDGAVGSLFGGGITLPQDAQIVLDGAVGNATITYDGTDILVGRGLKLSNNIQLSKGDDVAAANNLVLGTFGNLFRITGATQINLLSAADWQGGSEVTLIFDANPLVKHNQAASGNNQKILLAGAADFASSANDTLTLVFDGDNWYEKCRTVI